MHIPDGFLTPQVAIVGWLLTAVLLTCALAITQTQLGERQVPLMGVMGAFIFAAQAINFPIAGGTSGHLLGATLAAVVLGPWAAALVMACVIGLQGLLFADGGLLVMGWNIFNMGIVGAFVGDTVYRDIKRLEFPSAALVGAFVAAWISAVLAAAATALELAVSGTASLRIVLPAMVGVHIFMGFGEAVVTAAALAWLWKARPHALRQGEQASGTGLASVLTVGMLAALLLCLMAPLASTAPDGLARVAHRLGFEHLQQKGHGPMGDYTIPGLGEGALSTIVAMLVGAVALCLSCTLIGRVLSAVKGKRRTAAS